MITRTGGAWVHEYTCLNKDVNDLPTFEKDEKDIPNGSTALIMDKSKVMIYDRENDQWMPM